jgi:hypothetical protein
LFSAGIFMSNSIRGKSYRSERGRQMRSWLAAVSGLGVLLLLGFVQVMFARAADPPAGKETILKASDITGKVFPERVFFRGQVASVQMRNTAGIHFADDAYMLVGLVDNSGYSSDIRQKYQAYLLSEVTLEIGGQRLVPGAYGIGFLKDGKFVVIDLGAHDLFQTSAGHDTEIKRPVPLQILPTATAGTYRLYSGRDYVEIRRAP